MPQLIPAAAGAVASAVSGWAYAGAQAVGLSAATAASISTYAASIAGIGTVAAITVGLPLLARPSVPDPETGKQSRRQPRPARTVFMGGGSRSGGAYMLRETSGSTLAVVLALSDGRLDSISAIYLNDDLVALDGSGWVQQGPDGRYGAGDLIQIKTRMGVPTETHYSELTAKFGDLWPTTARGDGIGSLMMLASHRSKESFQKHFPNGEPMPTVVAQGVCYDWRQDSTAGGSGSQRRDNEATWQASGNPVVWLVHHEWYRCGRSWDRCIEPVLANLTDEADYCDEAVAKVGGTEPRYAFGGNYFADTQPQARREAILATCDGWLSTNGQGHMVVKVGRYQAPTFTLTGDHIVGYEWSAFTPDEEHINKLAISYTEPAKDYTETECDAWVDEDDVTATGMERSQPLALTWVQSRSQARRLAKRKMARLLCERRGQIVTGVYGLNAFGHRYIRVQNAELASMADVVVEVMGIEFDPMTASVVLDVILADTGIDAWNPATEEGNALSDAERPAPEALSAPTISSVTPFFEETGGGMGVRLAIAGDGPDRDDLTWFAGWRVDGAESWSESQYTDAAPGSPVLLDTSFVTADADLEVRIGYQTGGGTLSPWSTTATVNTATETYYDPVTNLILSPEAFDSADWAVSGSGASAPTVIANATTAPNGTITADRINFPAVSGGSSYSVVYTAAAISLLAQPYDLYLWLRGATGGEEIYIMATPDGATFYRLRVTLATAWQRFTLPFTPSAGNHYVQIGTDLRDGSQTSTAAATVYAWGAQLA